MTSTPTSTTAQQRSVAEAVLIRKCAPWLNWPAAAAYGDSALSSESRGLLSTTTKSTTTSPRRDGWAKGTPTTGRRFDTGARAAPARRRRAHTDVRPADHLRRRRLPACCQDAAKSSLAAGIALRGRRRQRQPAGQAAGNACCCIISTPGPTTDLHREEDNLRRGYCSTRQDEINAGRIPTAGG